MARWLIRIALGLVGLAVVGAIGIRLYLGSDGGRRVVERKVDEKVVAPLGGHIHIGHIGGTLVAGVTLDDVAWNDDEGRPFLSARRVVVKGSAVGVLARRPSVSVRIEAPQLDLDRLRAGIDLDEAARLLAEGREKVDSVTLDALEIVDGTVTASGHRFTGVALTGSARLERAQKLGDRGELYLDKLEAQTGGLPISAGGAVSWNETHVEAQKLALHAGKSEALAEGSVAPDAIDLRLSSLRLAAEDLRRLSPDAELPKHGLHGEARLHGPPEKLALTGALHPDAGAARLGGTIDSVARRGEIRLELDGFQAEYTPAVLDGTITVRGALDGDGDGEALAATFTADGSYRRRLIDPNVQRRVAATSPGGHFHGEGRLRYAGKLTVHYRVALDDPGQAARLVAGRDRDLPEAKPYVIEGSVP